MKVLSLFDGISCARVALERIGVDNVVYHASEIDKYAIQVAQKNYPSTIEIGSVTEVKGEGYKDIDLLIGGSPCQDLSIAKKNREGLKGQRSGLFFEYVRILNEVKPKFFVLENVNSMPKEAKEQISEILGVQPVMINAALVSAQNRKRLFWVGKLVGDKYEQIVIEQPEDRGILLKDILESEVDEKYYVHSTNWRVKRNLCESDAKSRTLNASNYKGALNDGMSLIRVGEFNQGGQGDRVYSEEGKSVALSALGGGQGAKTGLYLVAPNGKHIILGNSELQVFKESRTEEGKLSRKEIRKVTGKDSTLRSKDHKEYVGREGDKANCITTGLGMEGMIAENMQIRKLTPIECERLQGLPDNYTEGVSNTQRYKALGNAFNVDVVAHILKKLVQGKDS